MLRALAGEATRRVFLFLSFFVLLVAAPVASADPPRLPPVMQGAVNGAIDRGVGFLRLTQGPWGSWAAPKDNHKIAYAALPALTLLECGASPNDPAVLAAADFVRANAGAVDRTYELALSILFLDRLGEPKDEKLIEVFALRLVAGQTGTGGWSYKCPLVPAKTHKELLTFLKKIQPAVPFNPLVALAPPAGKPDLPAGIAPGGKADLPTGIAGGAASPDNPLGPPAKGQGSDFPGLLAGTRPELGGSLSMSQSSTPAAVIPADTAGAPWAPQTLQGRRPPGGMCIKLWDDPGPTGTDGPGAGAKKAPKKITIPRPLRGLAVVFDPNRLLLADPPNRLEAPLWGTTDNSNSQFGLLGLWVARRHGLPLDRSFFLLVRRYTTSQNPDGTWGYRYRYGGGEGGSAAMTCVGLLGLAVGHGLAHDTHGKAPQAALAQQLAKDPRIVNGFFALTAKIGMPTGRLQNLPMENLYFLWSVERVAVLYNLPTIGAKDWYRWGAEILLANQYQQGYWDKGGYPGATPIVDTCLALLFLKRANLAADLSDRLPFNAAKLNQDILKKAPPAPAKSAEAPAPPPVTPIPLPTGIPEQQKAVAPEPSPVPAPAAPSAPVPAPPTDMPREASSSNVLVWILALLAVLLLLAGGFFLFMAQRSDDQPRAAPPSRNGRGQARRKRRPAPG
jgi:hypothetical protein